MARATEAPARSRLDGEREEGENGWVFARRQKKNSTVREKKKKLLASPLVAVVFAAREGADARDRGTVKGSRRLGHNVPVE